VIIKTGYSFRHAVGHEDRVVARLKELGVQRACIADRMSTFGFVKFTKAARKAGVEVCYGVELPVTHDRAVKRGINFLDYWTFLAKDELRPLHDLVARATSSEVLSYNEVLRENPDVFKIAGPAVNLDAVRQIVDAHGVEAPFVALSAGTPRAVVRGALSQGLKLVAVQDNRYPGPGDRELYRVLLGSFFASSQTWPQHILHDDDLMNLAAGPVTPEVIQGAIDHRQAILEASTASLRRATLLSPPKPKDLRQLCLEGAERLGCDLSRTAYQERLDRELAMIREKDFDDYFHIVADLMEFARANMVVGPARGSSCGSLVCYLLGITSIDPIPFDLVFERFIDVTRTDLPDIDLDFSDARRHLIFDHMKRRYGKDHVARLGSVNTFGAKAAFKQVGVALKIPQGRINEIANTVIKRSMGDSRAGATIEDTFTETDVGRRFISEYPEAAITGAMEDHPSVAGQHAAGVVVTETPVLDFVAVDRRTGAAMCDKYDAEELNLLKIDALGLTQLSIFERTLELIGEAPRNDFLERIPLDDQSALDVLNAHKFSGIFQFQWPGSAMVNLTKHMTDLGTRIDQFEDIVALTALVRPGPLGSGQTDKWMQRRAGREEVEYEHEALRPYMEQTLGIVVYQEQVLRIGRELGDLSWADVTALRKAMSKSLGKEYFDQFGDRWKAHATGAHGIPQDVAEKFWNDMCQFGMWAFNRSHSVAYAMVSYWCCWLKAHHPLEFAAANLDSLSDIRLQVEALRELRDEGVGYVPVDAEKSTDRWEIDRENNRLVGPLSVVKGIGPKIVQQVLEARRTNTPLPKQAIRLLENPKTTIDSLEPIADAIAKVDLAESGVVSKLTRIGDIDDLPLEDNWTRHGNKRQRLVTVIAMVTKVAPLNENEPARVAKRGYEIRGQTEAVNLFIRDDTGEIFAKISRWQFESVGRRFLSRAKAQSSLFAIQGTVPEDFRMIYVDKVRYIGEFDEVAASKRWVAPKTKIAAVETGEVAPDTCVEGTGAAEPAHTEAAA
jgi:DNA polymerase III alpha subunit